MHNATWDARITTSTALAGLINGPLANDLANPTNHVITPKSPATSVLLTRIATRGTGSIQIPPLASSLVFGDATNVIAQWILSMTNATVTPSFNRISLSETNLIVVGSNGLPDGNYYVLTSTNVALPLTNWLRLSTNLFDPNGNFNFTNPMNSGTPQLFYLLELP